MKRRSSPGASASSSCSQAATRWVARPSGDARRHGSPRLLRTAISNKARAGERRGPNQASISSRPRPHKTAFPSRRAESR
jgi:hypothetical protein